jgi:hypothetical protein
VFLINLFNFMRPTRNLARARAHRRQTMGGSFI